MPVHLEERVRVVEREAGGPRLARSDRAAKLEKAPIIERLRAVAQAVRAPIDAFQAARIPALIDALQQAPSTPLQAIGALSAGFVTASVLESFIHEKVHHAPSEVVKRRREGGAIAQGMAMTFDGHNYHHGMARQHYDVENETAEQIAERRERLRKRDREYVLDDRFGVSVSNGGAARYLAAIAPVYAAGIGAAVALGAGITAVIGGLVGMFAAPIASKYIHPYLHDPSKPAPFLIRLLQRTPWWADMKLNHFVHHERAKGGVNYNILPGALGDKLRGKFDEATPTELAKARAIGLADK